MTNTDPNQPTNTTRETTVVHTNGGGGGASWLLIGILLVIVIGGIYAFSTGMIGGGEGATIDVDVSLPAAEGASE
ncbi:hypothetical protein [Yoonia sp. 208BN28-4]|uniref:hypothetical protein n=1 Tax=Yoonia sp. 208BN28-4 TaxID=3126505 RepID=UPI0030969144